MRYSFISAAILALTSTVFAQNPTANFDAITAPTLNQNVAAGSSLEIVWEPSTVHTGPVTIQLLQGATPETLVPGIVVASAIDQTKGSFTWKIPSDLPSFATYGFTITLDSSVTADPTTKIFQFSFPFHITGLSGGSSTTTGTTSGSASVYPTGTTTIHLSTGSAYSVTSTSTKVSSTSVSTSVNATTLTTSTYINVPTGSANLSTTLTPTVSRTSGGSSSPTGTTPPQQSTNAAVGNIATGSLAMIGGLLLAFVL